MSREHLYKAKRVNWRELPKEEWWVEGNLIANERDKSKAYIGYLFDVRNGVVEDFDIVEVIPETVCEYTGFTDKNGRKIWENGILKEGENIFAMEFCENKACFCIRKINAHYPGITYQEHYLPKWDAKFKEVIGNIFDNSELLKGDKAE